MTFHPKAKERKERAPYCAHHNQPVTGRQTLMSIYMRYLVKIIEAESRMVVASGKGNRELVFRVYIGEDGKVLEVNVGDSCTTI